MKSRDEIIKGIIHHKLREKSMQELNHDECFDCPYRPNEKKTCESIEPILDDILVLLKEQEEALHKLGQLLKERGEEIARLKTPTASDNKIPLKW